jgi:RNA polymerase sigma-70 factor (ECF subfamily)
VSLSALLQAPPAVSATRVELDVSAVYAEHGAFVFRALRRMGVPPNDVADATQQTFLIVHRQANDVKLETPVRAWLFGICVRVAKDWRQRAHVRREVVTEQLPERTDPRTPLAAAERSQARALLDEALDGLDEAKRTVFVLYELEEWTMPEVAAAVGCPLQTAYSRYRAARTEVEAALRQRIGEST